MVVWVTLCGIAFPPASAEPWLIAQPHDLQCKG